jgi:hypothetical protein
MPDAAPLDLTKIVHSNEAIALILEQMAAKQDKASAEEKSEVRADKTPLGDKEGPTTGKIDTLLGKITTIASALGGIFTLNKQAGDVSGLSSKVAPVTSPSLPPPQQPLPRVDDPGTAADEGGTSQDTIPGSTVAEKGASPSRNLDDETMADFGDKFTDAFAVNRKEQAEADRLRSQKETSAAMASPEGGGGGLMAGLLGMAAIFAAVLAKKLLGVAKQGVNIIKRGAQSVATKLKGVWGGVKNKWNSLWGKDKPEVIKKDGARAFKRGTGSRAPTVTAKEIPKKMPWYKKAWEGTKSGVGKAWKGAKGIAGRVAATAGGKSLLKKIPGVGLVAGGIFGAHRAMKGDWLGAAGEVASGAAASFPPIGTGGSLAIDAALLAHDMNRAKKKKEETPLLPETSQLTPDSPLFKEDAPIQIPAEKKAAAVQPWFPSPAIAKPTKRMSGLGEGVTPAGMPSRSALLTAGSSGSRMKPGGDSPITKDEVKKTVTDIVTNVHKEELVTTKAVEPSTETTDTVQPAGEEVADVTDKDTAPTRRDKSSTWDKIKLAAHKGQGVVAGALGGLAAKYTPGADKKKDTEDGDGGEKLMTIEDHLAAMRESMESVNNHLEGLRREFPESIAAIPAGGGGSSTTVKQGPQGGSGDTMTQSIRNMVRRG